MTSSPSVLVIYPQVPFVRGGTERLAAALCAQLKERGLRADVVTVPFCWEPKEVVVREALAWRLLDLRADLVIPLKFPAYFVKHRCKVAWLQHQFRQIYEFHGMPLGGFADTPPDHELRERLAAMDTRCLRECKAIYTNSGNTLSRLRKYSGLDGESLYPPPMNAGLLKCEEYGDFILAVGRLEDVKRFDLCIRAISKAGGDVRAKIVGDGSEAESLRELALNLGVGERVEFLGWVDDKLLAELYNNCRAVHFAPLDEDYGLVAVEALTAGKPVITATDSGGPLEHVRDGVSGLVVPPDAGAQAEAIGRLWADRELCRRLGEQGREDVRGISWGAVLDRLLQWIGA
jgi:glycosyltransferase involved in cell wall biosynthesis